MNCKHDIARRKGLAPLEFVLWLPVLLFVTALMVNFGTMAAWRVRGEIVSRDAVWRSRWPRSGATEPRPEKRVWPKEATMELSKDSPFGSIDIPAIQHPVVRGPLPNGFVVRPTLDPKRNGTLKGTSSIVRDYPMLPKLGQFESGKIENSLFDRKRQVSEMQIRSNRSRRIPHIYQLPQTDQSLPLAFINAVKGLFAMANFEALNVLYWDDELLRLLGRRVDFHPRVNSRYQRTDPAEVRELAVKPLVDHLNSRGKVVLGQISRLPRQMTSTFLNAYRQEVSRIEEQIRRLRELLEDPSITTKQRMEIEKQIRSLEAQIAVYTPKIEQLKAYQSRLPEIEAKLKDKFLDYLSSRT